MTKHFFEPEKATKPIKLYFTDAANQIKSEFLFYQLKSLSDTNFELKQLLNDKKQYLEHGLKSMFSTIDLSRLVDIKENHYNFDVVALENDIVTAIYRFGDFDENKEYNEFTKIYWISNDYKITKNTKLICCDNNNLVSKNKEKYRKIDVEYLYEENKEKRLNKVFEITFLKAVHEVFQQYDGDPDNKDAIVNHLCIMYYELYRNLYGKKYILRKMTSFTIKIFDFEYDEKRCKMYMDFSLSYDFISENNVLVHSKYNSITPSIDRMKTFDKHNILNGMLFNTLLKFHVFSQLFLNINHKTQIQDLGINGIPLEYRKLINQTSQTKIHGIHSYKKA